MAEAARKLTVSAPFGRPAPSASEKSLFDELGIPRPSNKPASHAAPQSASGNVSLLDELGLRDQGADPGQVAQVGGPATGQGEGAPAVSLFDELGLRDQEAPPLRKGFEAAKDFLTSLPQRAATAGGGLLDYLGETAANVPGDARKFVESSVWLPAQLTMAGMGLGPPGFSRERALAELKAPGGLLSIDPTEIPGALYEHYKRYVTHPLDTFKAEPVQTLADLLPVAAVGSAVTKAGRAGLRAARRNAMLGPANRAAVKNWLGTAAESLGSDAYGSMFYNKAAEALARKGMHADTGRRTLTPWVQKAAQRIPGMTPEGGLNLAQRFRDWVSVLSDRLGQKIGLTPKELDEAALLAETIPNNWHQVTIPGKQKTLVLKGGVKDPETGTWRHGIDPEAFNQRFNAMRPEAQRLVMEFIAPLDGYGPAPFTPPRVLLGSAKGQTLPVPTGAATTMSRNLAFDEAVKLGILNPAQRAEGYVRRLWDRITPELPPRGAPELTLDPFRPGFTSKRTGQAKVGRLDEAISTYRADLEAARLNRQMLKELGDTLMEPYEDGDPLVRYRQVYNPASRQPELRAEQQTLVYVRPEEAQALGLDNAGRYAIPSAFEERFNLLLGRLRKGELGASLEGLKDLVKDASRYWQTNVLLAPGTVGTNLISGLGQFSGKVFEDMARPQGLHRTINNARGVAGALNPFNWQRYPAEMLGANVRTQFAGDTARLFSRVAEKVRAGEKVSLPARALGRLDQALGAAMNLGMQPFGKVENFWKRSILLSELRTWAENEVKALNLTGKARRAKVEDLMAGAFRERPDVFKEAMLGAVDRFAFDYDNIPARLESWRKSPFGAMLMPFMVYPYKYARMLGSQAKAFNPLTAMPVRERVARAIGLGGAAGAPWAIRELLTDGDSKILADQERFKKEVPDAEVPGARLWGREYLGKTDDGKSEVFLRTVKYPYWNLPIVRRGTESLIEALDEFKTKGPLLSPLLYVAFQHKPKLGPQKLSEQMGEVAKSAIPFFRVLEYAARQGDVDPEGRMIQRQPHGFSEQVKQVIPPQMKTFLKPLGLGTREDLAERIDWQGNQQPLRQDPGIEALKFWTGINLKVEDLARHNLTVHKAVRKYSRVAMKDEEVAGYVSRWLQDLGREPDPDKIKENMPKLHRISDNMLRSELGRVDEQVLENYAHRPGFNLFDAGQQEAVGVRMDQWNRLAKKVKGATAAGQLGIQPNEALNGLVGFGKLIRLYGIREWVRQHPEMLSR